MINLDDVEDGIKKLERAARLGLSGAMITEYPLEDRRYDQPEYEPFWSAAEALDLPLSLHTATRRQGRIRGAGDKTLRDASSRATKAFYPALSLCDLIFSGVFETQRRIPPQRRRRSASSSRRASSAASASSQSRKRPIFATFAVAFGQTIQ
jgi:transcriptional regulator with XRE-family HTH domain